MDPEIEISTDRTRIDVDFVHAALTTTYWAPGRSRATVEKCIEHSICFGAYADGRQIGFARVVSDRAVFAYLMDVYVAPEFRGRGVGKALMKAALEHEDLQGLQLFLLRTRDAHALYAQFGFTDVSNPSELMARTREAE